MRAPVLCLMTLIYAVLFAAPTRGNIVENPSFELSPRFDRFTGWVSKDVERMGPYIDSADGYQSVDLAKRESGWIEQVLITEPDAHYTLSFALSANIYEHREVTRRVQVTWGTADLGIFTWNQLGEEAPREARFERYTFLNLRAASVLTLLRFEDLSDTSGYGMVLDDVRVTLQPEGLLIAPVPGSLACGIAIVSLFAVRRPS
ncbi:DUF642 domain-containing protein [Mucisphaera calidilacus]|uniref:Uncharacterized protein n=1 Tax=Mucisphaera calidilacus TaxID=2527982 RepID=A0A518BWD3_9BACT|nr:DUF642 domain-containing protein [Mucisphaera calidilacus]QDU71285.1 hypothetical protein Pan265_11340 [Mucisphaera calidilacus]